MSEARRFPNYRALSLFVNNGVLLSVAATVERCSQRHVGIHDQVRSLGEVEGFDGTPFFMLIHCAAMRAYLTAHVASA